ncbi:MAG TPA: PEP-CTERM sorting domain-containing protein, partial [Verrucomicrobiae bacterium]|nr:PEP-CTERM sorting domain-containing protein [Verrucomicrobiae bacterium]
LHLFLYSDFNLGPSPTETVWFPNSTTVYQSNSVAFPDGANLQTVETPQSGPTPTVSEETGLSPSILDSLTDGSPTTLSGTNMLTGDATWAFEWDVNIGAGLSEQISLNNLLFVPEPSSLMLGLSGLLLLAVTLRRARRVG